MEGDFKEESGYQVTKKIMGLSSPPTAIFSCNNLMSIGALKAILDMKIELIKDVSFIGFDDIEIATFVRPQITTVSRPIRQLGEIAFQMLYDQITNKSNEEKVK